MNMAKEIFLETPRLYLRNPSVRDFERFFLMSKDPDVMKFIGNGNIFYWTKEVAFEKYMQTLSSSEKNDGFTGSLSVYRKDQDLYIGWCNIGYSGFLDHMELGYRYLKDSWGKGYATEAGYAYLKEMFVRTDISEVQSCVHPENMKSIKVLEKLGFAYSHNKYSRPVSRDIFVYQVDCELLERCHMVPG